MGAAQKGERIKDDGIGAAYNADNLGVFTPPTTARRALRGRGGLHHCGHQELKAAKVGDTITLKKAAQQPGPRPPGAAGFKGNPAPGVRRSLPDRSQRYDQLRDALEKLQLNDASLHFEPEVSQALGFGFRCGFLGLLHMEIVQERLEREFDQDLITTAPSVVYEVVRGDGDGHHGGEPSKMPEQGRIQEIREPIVTVHLYMPQEYVGPVMTLATRSAACS